MFRSAKSGKPIKKENFNKGAENMELSIPPIVEDEEVAEQMES